MKKTGLTLLKVVVSLGILAYIFTKVVDIRLLWANLKQADLSYFVAAILMYFVVQALSAYRWYLLLKPQGIEVSYWRILSFYFLGMYFNFFLPSAIGGDVFRVYYLNKETRRLSASTASVFLDRDVGMGGLVLVGTLVAWSSGTRFNGVLLAPIFAVIAIMFVGANLAIFYRPTYNLLHRVLSLVRMKRVDEKVENLFESVNCYRGKWGLLVTTLLMSVGVQVGCAFVNMLSAHAIGMHTRNGWLDYLIFIPTIGLIGMAPITLNGAGFREAAYILLFKSVIDLVRGIPVSAGDPAIETAAATLAVLWLGVVVATSLPGGIIYVARGGRKHDRIPDNIEAIAGITDA
jgi:glycosyltransferase 2 family protein